MEILAEKWRDVIGNPFYQVSNQGRVRSIDRTIKDKIGRSHVFSSKILKGQVDYKGYLRVGLYKGFKGGCTIKRIHTIVAEAWIGDCPVGKQVNHIDGIKTNNRVDNLEYVTCRDNIRHAWRTGLVDAANRHGENNARAKVTEKDIRHAHEMVKAGASSKDEARKLGITPAALSAALTGKNWKHLNLG